MDLNTIITLVIIWIVWAVIGGLVGMLKGRLGAGAIWGFLFGPIGWIIVLLGPDLRIKCPACKSVIDRQAAICPHCRTSVHFTLRPYRAAGLKRNADPLGIHRKS